MKITLHLKMKLYIQGGNKNEWLVGQKWNNDIVQHIEKSDDKITIVGKYIIIPQKHLKHNFNNINFIEIPGIKTSWIASFIYTNTEDQYYKHGYIINTDTLISRAYIYAKNPNEISHSGYKKVDMQILKEYKN